MRAECGGEDAEELDSREERLRESVDDDGAMIAYLQAEVDRLKTKCNMQAIVLRALNPERFPGTPFIMGHFGEKDANGLPERLLIAPSFGVDWGQFYVKSDKTAGMEW